jgi:transcription antitermination factor NusG
LVSDSSWGVVITKPLGEEVAARALSNGGWRVYLPRYRKILKGVRLDAEGRRHRTRGQGEIVLRPLFPRYLFVDLTRRAWSEMVRLPGVLALVGGVVGGEWRPYAVGDEVVEAVRGAERSGRWDEAGEGGRRKDLKAGDRVRIAELGDLVGELDEIGEDDRAWVLLTFLGRQVRPEVSARSLVSAG